MECSRPKSNSRRLLSLGGTARCARTNIKYDPAVLKGDFPGDFMFAYMGFVILDILIAAN